MPVIAHETLTNFAVQLLSAGGADAEEAAIVADSLVQANLRGHDSHGVMRIPFYLQNVKSGRLHAGARLTIVREAASVLVTDGSWGFGQVLARDLTNRLIEKAGTTGIACGSLRQSAHIGRLGEYAEMAAAKEMAAIIMAAAIRFGWRAAVSSRGWPTGRPMISLIILCAIPCMFTT